ncbi:cytochrome o ubiquinol oxidase subunit IV [Azohydromonas caseinilytica]|uniref:Cytochrome bo(3) ubiquinol oxidase subunit 4 n=1 Tax=Azohydromonas caseinilytica TaxID=2728836 RepID=A0A848FAD7_9BURK|nr:cytochrome o ubiquinol oxidase subunit IV [Azohydromonas caseinilytica]NML16504.1 cytochrome o ubiquinol oxidase subunit IV [Azohydromonas caseinilytica]
MSQAHTQPHDDLGHDHVHDHGHDNHGDDYHATVQDYVKGFVLAAILTAIPFWLVMGKVIESSTTTSLVILGFAAVQIVVHMVYFLHLNSKSQGGWNMLSLIFTAVLLIIMLIGSIWVMFHLNTNLMDMPRHETTQNP